MRFIMSIVSFGLIERDGEILFSIHVNVTCQEVSFTCFLLLIHSIMPAANCCVAMIWDVIVSRHGVREVADSRQSQ
jgi:hypothetical protein